MNNRLLELAQEAEQARGRQFLTEVYEFGPDNDLIIKLPEELLEELKWFEGDKIIWIDNNDGSFSLRKL